ncbi:MAG: chain length determinant family protein [Acidobacteria bacterium]|nr:chain length determinant family protein [Acidobacteriota bacterium]
MALDVSTQESQAPSEPATVPRSSRSDDLSFLDILIVLAEHKATIGLVTLVFAVLAIILSLLLPKRYTATTTLLPPQQNSSLASALSSQLGSLSGMASLAGGSLGLKNPNDMYVGMLKSRTVEDAMVQRFELMQEYRKKFASDARHELENHTKVDGSGKDGLIHISIDDRDPKRAAELANGYVDQFRKLSEHMAITEASQRRLFFQQQLEETKESLANAEEALKQTEQKTGLIQVDAQARALIESAALLRAQIAAKEVQIESLKTFATGENSQLVQSQKELDALRGQLAKLGGSANIDEGLIVPKGQVPAAGLDYVRKLRDVKYYETVFNILARQFEIAKVDEAKQGSLIQVVDAATIPDKRSFPNRTLIVICSILAGFFAGVVVALLQAITKRVKGEPRLAQRYHLFRDALSFRKRPA